MKDLRREHVMLTNKKRRKGKMHVTLQKCNTRKITEAGLTSVQSSQLFYFLG